jgi:ferric iron reductase protein FhuF
LDIPALNVAITEKALTGSITQDEEISLNITYLKEISIDKLIITLTYVYKDEIVSNERLFFTKCLFRI